MACYGLLDPLTTLPCTAMGPAMHCYGTCHALLWSAMRPGDIYGTFQTLPCIAMLCYGPCHALLWIAVACYGLLWIAMDCYGLLWTAVDCCGPCYGLLWTAMVWRGLRAAIDCCGLHWVATDSNGLLQTTVDCCALLRIAIDGYCWTTSQNTTLHD